MSPGLEHRFPFHRLVLIWFGCFATSRAAISSTDTASAATTQQQRSFLPLSEVPYSKREVAEQRRAWREICNSCRGCWSGSLSIHDVKKNNKLVVRQPPKLNFRLQVKKTKRNKGTWTVWNLMEKGDETVVPLRMTPAKRPTQIKIAFEGIILRIPSTMDNLPRIVFEIGFWDSETRRTMVAEYKQDKRWLSSSCSWHLDDITLVQMRRQPTRGFVGNMTNADHIAYLPATSTLDLDWDWWKPVKSETIDLVSLQRSSVSLKNNNQLQQEVHERISKAFNEDALNVYILPNSICASMPKRVDPSSTEVRACFAHQWNDEELLVVVQVDYKGRRAASVTLHSFRKV